MTTKVTVDGVERYAVLFPTYDVEGCTEVMEKGLFDVLETVAESEDAKGAIPPCALGQLVKMCRMLSERPEWLTD